MGGPRTASSALVALYLLVAAGCPSGEEDPPPPSPDQDGDGWTLDDGDCDDADPWTHPGAPEACNGLDNDCDGAVDEDFDLDEDGATTCGADAVFGTGDDDCDDQAPEMNPHDEDGDGWSSCDGDCDDGDPVMHPGDQDGDGYSPCGCDCDDGDPAVYPGAVEVCDGVDDDCDGSMLEGEDVDDDGDGVLACADCDDADPDVYTGAPGTISVPLDHPTLQGAIDAASEGDLICVDVGTYLEALDIGTASLKLVAAHGPEFTVIRAGPEPPIVRIHDVEGVSVIGFTVTGAVAGPGIGEGLQGGGIAITDAEVELSGMVVEDNLTYEAEGGGIYLARSTVVLEDSVVRANTAVLGSGGGIAAFEQSDLTLRDVTVSGNYGGGPYGGGIVVAGDSSFHAEDTILQDNEAYGDGGGLQAHGGTIEAVRLTVQGNHAEDAGGGMALAGQAELTLDDSLIEGNTSYLHGGGIHLSFAAITASNVVFSGNEAVHDGGGIAANPGEICLDACDVSDNLADEGGGIHAYTDSTVELWTVTVTDNVANDSGGGGLVVDTGDANLVQVTASGNTGAGLKLDSATVTVEDSEFIGNWATWGGGIYAWDGELTLTGVRFEANSACYGGAMELYQGGLHAVDLVVVDNDANLMGGGFDLASVHGSVEQSLFAGNTLTAGFMCMGGAMRVATSSLTFRNVAIVDSDTQSCRGGAIDLGGGQPTFVNVVLLRNRTTGEGGAIGAMSSAAVFRNVVLAGNVAQEGGAVWIGDPSSPITFSSSSFWDNGADAVVGIPDPVGADGNVALDPLFLDLSAPDALDWDLHLGPDSPLIDAGDPDLLDPDGSPSDIGCYGGPGAAEWDLDRDGYFEWWLPGQYNAVTSPGMDCDDQDDSVYPGNGC